MKFREDGRVVNTSVLPTTTIARVRISAESYRELLGAQVDTSESAASWTGFFRVPKVRVLHRV